MDRADLARVAVGLARMPDLARREALARTHAEASATLETARASWHSFTFDVTADALEERGGRS